MPAESTLNQVQIMPGGRLFQLREMAALLVVAVLEPVILIIDAAQLLVAGRGMQHHMPAVPALDQTRLLNRESIVHLPARTDWASCRGGCH